MIISDAVSSGSPRPTGLNGSWRLSAPAATLTPACCRARTAVTALGVATGAVATLQEQVGVGEGDHVDACCGDLLGDLLLSMHRLQRERHAVTGRDSEGEPGGDHPLGEILQGTDRRIERLVGVQVDRQAGLGGHRQEVVVGRNRIGLQMGASADDVDPHRDRVTKQRALVGSFRADRRPGAQRSDLDVDERPETIAHLDQRLNRHQTGAHREIDVSADRRTAVGRQQDRGTLGTLDRVGEGDRRASLLHRTDGTEQVTGGVVDALGQERLVEVSVRFGKGRQHEVAVVGQRLSSERQVCSHER